MRYSGAHSGDGSEVYSYKGHSYRPWDDYEEDNIKRFHDVYVSDGLVEVSNGSIPLSPYSRASFELFSRWIDMGKPTREQMGGHMNSDHEAYYQKWITEQLEKELQLKESI